MTGSNDRGNMNIVLAGFDSEKELADELNSFFLRFEKHDISDTLNALKNNIRAPPALSLDVRSVEKHFSLTKQRKSPADNIWFLLPVLNSCAASFIIFSRYLFSNRGFLRYGNIPLLSQLTKNPATLNDFRPAALTSLIMKTLEKLIKHENLLQVEELLDPLQFAVCEGEWHFLRSAAPLPLVLLKSSFSLHYSIFCTPVTVAANILTDTSLNLLMTRWL